MSLLLEARGLVKRYPVRRGLAAWLRGRGGRWLHAVDGVDLEVRRGEILTILGESGCGKSTAARLLVRLERPTAGELRFDGVDVGRLSRAALRGFRRRVQMVFQNPYEAFDPRFTVGQSLLDPLRIHGIGRTREERLARVRDALERAGLRPADRFLDRYPHELSGGQLQRVAILRAMVLEPELLVADEPVSMLDVSVRAEILNMILDLRAEKGTAVVLITHDIGVARYVSDRVAVMYLGRVVEIGPAREVLSRPRHPYTMALLANAPQADPDAGPPALRIEGEPGTPIDPPARCRFAGRCPFAAPACLRLDPRPVEVGPGHAAACLACVDEPLPDAPVLSGDGAAGAASLARRSDPTP